MAFEISPEDMQSVWLTLKLALLTTVLLLTCCTPIAWFLSRSSFKLKPIIESLLTLPLVLPPTVIGFYLLLLLGKNGPPILNGLAFSFEGLVLGSMIYSLPFVIRPLQDAFSQVDDELLEAAATLGANGIDRFKSIVLPLTKNAFYTAFILGFSHTIGEFGVVLMIGGNIPGETKVLSMAVYDHVEALEYTQAHTLSIILLIVSLALLTCVNYLNKRTNRASLWT